MGRRLLTVAATVSLLCSVAILVVWIRSYPIADRYYFAARPSSMNSLPRPASVRWREQYALVLSRGQLRLIREESPFFVGVQGWERLATSDAMERRTGYEKVGFTFAHFPASAKLTPTSSAMSTGHLAVGIPLWFLIILALLVPAFWWFTGDFGASQGPNGKCDS